MDNHKAGPELDILVAERVLGWVWAPTKTGDGYNWKKGGALYRSVPPFSTGSDDFVTIIYKLLEDGWHVDMRSGEDGWAVNVTCSCGPCERHGNPHHNYHGVFFIKGETLALAVCRAALLVYPEKKIDL